MSLSYSRVFDLKGHVICNELSKTGSTPVGYGWYMCIPLYIFNQVTTKTQTPRKLGWQCQTTVTFTSTTRRDAVTSSLCIDTQWRLLQLIVDTLRRWTCVDPCIDAILNNISRDTCSFMTLTVVIRKTPWGYDVILQTQVILPWIWYKALQKETHCNWVILLFALVLSPFLKYKHKTLQLQFSYFWLIIRKINSLLAKGKTFGNL